jgi:acyl-CoA synthetase (NDP forming)
MDILASHGIAVPERVVVEDLPERVPFDFPVVLKVSDPRMLHKTEVGGVVLNIRDRDELRTRFAEMKERFPASKFLIERMEKPGVEMIVGLSRDDAFGLIVVLGLGGIYTELYRDVAVRVLPIEEVDADEMILGIRAAKLFDGFRNIKASREALKDTLLKVSRLGEDLADRIEQLDLNPVFVREQDAVAVDAKIILR